MPQTVFEVASPQCVAEDFDGEIVALNMDTGTYFSVKGNAARVWNDLVHGHALEALIERAGANAALAGAIESFAAEAQKEGLIRLAEMPGTPSAAPGTDFGDTELPVLEAFHDMQSLLLLDPVHEVDEDEGWPKRSA